MASADHTIAVGAVGVLPRRLGRYELITPIGRGGMAVVYAGRATGSAGFERLVAVKVCFESIREEPKFREMFLDEAKVAAHIHHPNVVATLDARDDDELYLVMDYVQGGSLAQMVRAVGRDSTQIPTAIGLRICIDALTGLHAAHNTKDTLGRPLDLVHRDVSPQNIMVGIDGVSRIVDFGIAKAVGREGETRTGEIKGKMAYLAPEQLLAEGLSPRTDVFAMGVVLWETLAGRKLFGGGSMEETVMALAQLRIPPLREIRSEVNEKVEAVVLKALQRAPEDRFASAGDMVDALEAAGMPIAPQKDVAHYVETLLGEKLATRAEVIRRASEQAAADREANPSERRPTIAPKAEHDHTQEDPSATPGPHELDLEAIGVGRSAGSRWLRRNGVLVGAAAILVVCIGAVVATRGSRTAVATSSAPAHTTAASASPSTHVDPPAHVEPVAHIDPPAHVEPVAHIDPPAPATTAPATTTHASGALPTHAVASPSSTTSTRGNTGVNAAHPSNPTTNGSFVPRRRRREYRPDML